MSSKRLAGEIEKCLREAQAHMQTYDWKWRELKCYNEATASAGWATAGQCALRAPAPPPLQLASLRARGRAPPPLPEVVCVDVSAMGERQVAEHKEKLKNELELLMKKVYRSRQQMLDWLNHCDLRQCAFSREDLLEAKKEIESRHRRGKVYYLRGVSSEDTSNEQTALPQEAYSWIELYVDRFRGRAEALTTELERRVQSGDTDIEQLSAAVECYLLHAERLEELALKKLRSEGADAAYLETLSEKLEALRAALAPLSEGEEPACLVAEDVYEDLSRTPPPPRRPAPPPFPAGSVPAAPPSFAAPPPRPAPEWVRSCGLHLKNGVVGELPPDLCGEIPAAIYPVCVFEAPLETALLDWSGEIFDGRLVTDRTHILCLERGKKVQVLATARNETWTFGRLADAPAAQGWFPSAFITRQRFFPAA